MRPAATRASPAQAVPTKTSSGWWRDVALLRNEKQTARLAE